MVVRVTTLKETICLNVLDSTKQPEVIYSHPDILTKYSTFFLESGVEAVATANTSIACREIKEKGNPFYAALAPEVVGKRYGLVTAPGFAENETTIRTRYGLIGQNEEKDPSHNYASILYLQPQEDRAGTLLEILNVFRQEGVNLRRLRSQNRGGELSHGFVVELDGHPQDSNVGFALMVLLSQNVSLKFLGVFPVVGGTLSPEKPVKPSGLLVGEEAMPELFGNL